MQASAGSGDVDPAHGWTTVTIKNKVYSTFCKETGVILKRGLQQWLLKRVMVMSSLVHKFVERKVAINEDPFHSLDGICYLSVAAAAEVAWWQAGHRKCMNWSDQQSQKAQKEL